MKNIVRGIFSGVCAGVIALMLVDLQEREILFGNITSAFLYEYIDIIVFIITFGLFYTSIGKLFADRVAPKIENALIKYPLRDILMYIIGLSIGLAVANLGGSPLMNGRSESINMIWAILLYVGLGYFGTYIVHVKKEEIRGWFYKKNTHIMHAQPKILDTSVIIDGRILDIVKTSFLEGKIIIPSFVLDEVRHIADSSDRLKRKRGRRGLDVLKEIQNIKNIPVEIIHQNYADIEEVDMKLLKLAEEIQGSIITNDFNLNKVAQLKEVVVLNINDLANAVKSIVLPNEEMTVMISKEGKEQQQGIAYLNDGTMIVVEQGRKYVGQNKQIIVSSVLQTSAGRMIFAKIIE